jgi:hypothetical protein
MKKAAALILLAIAAEWFVLRGPPPAHWRGMPAPRDPIQASYDLPPAFPDGAYSIHPLATFSVTAVVLHRERYRFDNAADLAPLDLALGWGPISVASVINGLKISQSDRWYEYSWKDDPPVDPSLIPTHAGNFHCLPADNNVRDQLLAIHYHDLVTLEGYLVEVDGPNGYRWRSNLTNNSLGEHGCRVMWITSVSDHKI